MTNRAQTKPEHRARRRHRKSAMLGLLAAGVAALVIAPSVASASPVPTGGTGSTVLTVGGPALTQLSSGGCGPFAVSARNGAAVLSTGKSGFRLLFPISQVDIQGDESAIRIEHAGSIDITNSCYTISLGALRFGNFGMPDQLTTFDLSAVTHSANDSGRTVVGEFDLSSASVNCSGTKVRIEKMGILTNDQGATILNDLAVGSDTGPFTSGMQIGSAKTTIVYGY